MGSQYAIVVVTRLHAEEGTAEDEFVMEWLPGSLKPAERVLVLKLPATSNSEWSGSKPAGSQGAILVLIHGSTKCGSGSDALKKLLENEAKPALPAEGAEVHLYLHAGEHASAYTEADSGNIFGSASRTFLTYTGGSDTPATVNLLEKMQSNDTPDWIVREVEKLVHPGFVGRLHLLRLQDELLRLFLDFAVLAVPDQEEILVQKASKDLLETYVEILRRLHLGFWRTGSWPLKDHLIFQLTEDWVPSPARRGLKCWGEVWRRLSIEAAIREVVAELQVGATSLLDLEADLTRLASSIDELLVVAAQLSPHNLEAEVEP